MDRPEPRVNDPCTISIGSDSYPGTVVGTTYFVSGAKKGLVRKLVVQEDDARVVSGSAFDGSAQYEYTRNSTGRRWEFRRNHAGNFQDGSYRCTVGHRRKHRDPHF